MPGRGSEGAAPLPPVPTRLRCGGKREGKSGAAARAPVAGPERFSLSGAFFLRHQLLPGGGGGGPAWARAGAGPGPARSAPPRPGTGRTRGGGRTRARDSAGRGWRGRTGRRELRAQGSAVRGRQRGGRRQWRRLLALPAAAAQPRLAGPRGQDGGAGSAFRTRPSAAAVRPPERGGDAPPVCPPGAAAPGRPPPRCVGVRGGGEGRTRAVGHTQTHARTASGARARAGPASRRLGARALSIVARAAPPGARRGPDGDVRAVTMVTSARPPPAGLGPGRERDGRAGVGGAGGFGPQGPQSRARTPLRDTGAFRKLDGAFVPSCRLPGAAGTAPSLAELRDKALRAHGWLSGCPAQGLQLESMISTDPSDSEYSVILWFFFL